MEKTEKEFYIVYNHQTTYRGEDIYVTIKDDKNKETIHVTVNTPVKDTVNRKSARFYRDAKVKSMREARKTARTYITEATTDIDKHLSKEESLEEFFGSVDEQVESLEGKATAIKQQFDKELEKI